MNRRYLVFIVLLNALISVVVALAVVWAVESRRPDLEALAINATPVAVLATQPPGGANAVVTPTAATMETADSAANTPAEPSTAGEAEPTATLDPATQQIYTIQAGDSLSAVADRFGTTLDAIVKVNELSDPNVVYVGQRLIIPVRDTSGQTTTPQPQAPTATTSLETGQGILIRKIEGVGTLLTEAVQIVNDSNTGVNLTGWRLERVDGPAYTFVTLSIFPGGNIWVHTTNGDDTSVALYWDQPAPVWQSGSVARLLDAQGNVIHTYPVP